MGHTGHGRVSHVGAIHQLLNMFSTLSLWRYSGSLRVFNTVQVRYPWRLRLEPDVPDRWINHKILDPSFVFYCSRVAFQVWVEGSCCLAWCYLWVGNFGVCQEYCDNLNDQKDGRV